MTLKPIVIGAFGMITKGLLKGLEDLEVGGRVETIQTTALLKTTRILRRVLETWGDFLSLNLQWKTLMNNNNNKAFHLRDDTGCISQEKEEEDAPALKIHR